MYASLHIPAFSLSVLLRDDPESALAPAALVGSTPASTRTAPLLAAVNQAATRVRVIPGLTTTRALARCPHLQLLPPDPARERSCQDDCRRFTASLSPDFEESAPGTFLIDLFTVPHARSAPGPWVEQTLRKATALRLPLHLALAPTPDLALLGVRSSRHAARLVFTPQPEFRLPATLHLEGETLADLPLSLLDDEHDASLDHDLLQLWGLDTLGALAALPRQGLAERLDPAVARLHDILHGKHHRLLTLHRPPQRFHASGELEFALETLEPLLFLLRRSLDTLCARLAASQRAAISMRLGLTFDDGDLHQRELRLPEPSRHPDTLLRLLHTHLDTFVAPAPVTAFDLRLTPTLPGEAQHHLFERSLRDPNKLSDTLARLEALLGPNRLGVPVPANTHRPDSFGVQPFLWQDAGTPRPTSFATPPPVTALPLKRYRPPVEVHVASEACGRHQRPLALLTGPHRGAITSLHGPFPLSGSWWDPEESWQRVEWDLQLADQTLLRLVSRPLAPGEHQWFLEGIYE